MDDESRQTGVKSGIHHSRISGTGCIGCSSIRVWGRLINAVEKAIFGKVVINFEVVLDRCKIIGKTGHKAVVRFEPAVYN